MNVVLAPVVSEKSTRVADKNRQYVFRVADSATDQWRYERGFTAYDALPMRQRSKPGGHTIDMQVDVVRRGWLPFFPQFNRSTLEILREAQDQGCKTDAEIIQYILDQLRSRKLWFSVEGPDFPENWPRVWFIWRGNAIGTSAKGHEFFLRHYLGTHSKAIAAEIAENHVSEVAYRPDAPLGKFDLVVDIKFRMDTSALYSDIVLPAATW